jgi:hypothetical protein
VDLSARRPHPGVELHVDTLVCTGLPGLRPEHGEYVAEAFTRELDRLLRTRPVTPICDRSLTELAGLPVLDLPCPPRRLGVLLARGLHERLLGLDRDASRDDDAPPTSGGRDG